ncbi:MAG: PorT family protein [Calditrichia bacterium]|nr:PorT family protein [Calditrichia bacterium]
MKKLFFVLFMVVMLSSMGFSQISYGITCGVNMSKFTGDVKDIDPSFKAGIAGGVVAEVGLLGLSVAPEVLFVMKGSKFKLNDVEYSSKYNYIEVPVLARYYIPSIVIKPFITAGPYYSMLLSANEKYTINGNSKEDDVKDTMESQDFGLKVGVGIKLSKLTVMARYSMGLKATNKEGDDKKNATMELMAAFTF